MPVALGYEAYAAMIMQTAFGTAGVPTVTYAHLRNGSPISPQSSVRPRISTASIMPKASQVWTGVNLCQVAYEFEINSHASAWLLPTNAAWGKRVKTTGTPDTDVFTIVNPPVDGGTDTGTDFYNHSMTIRQTMAGVATYEIRDVCIDQWKLTIPRDDTIKMAIEGTGQAFQSASPVSYVDIGGTTYSHSHVISSANGGLQVGSANPPTNSNQMIVKQLVFTLNNNLIFEAQAGGVSGAALRLPTRNDYPVVTVDFDMWFTDTEASDSVSMTTDFIANVARNFRAKAFLDSNNALELLATGSTAPMFFDTPRPIISGPGPVGFQIQGKCFPEVSTDVKFTWTSP